MINYHSLSEGYGPYGVEDSYGFSKGLPSVSRHPCLKNKMKPTNPNAHTYVNGTDVKTHGYAVTLITFLQ